MPQQMHSEGITRTPLINAIQAEGFIKANDVSDVGLEVLMFVKYPMQVTVIAVAGGPRVPVAIGNLRDGHALVLDLAPHFRNGNAVCQEAVGEELIYKVACDGGLFRPTRDALSMFQLLLKSAIGCLAVLAQPIIRRFSIRVSRCLISAAIGQGNPDGCGQSDHSNGRKPDGSPRD